MAWSYRIDRADEMYNEKGGPVLTDHEPYAPPPAEVIPENETPEAKVKRETKRDAERAKNDPDFALPVETPEERQKRESAHVVQGVELEQIRIANIEKGRLVQEEKNRIEREELEKENEELRKQAADEAKKQLEEEKKLKKETQDRLKKETAKEETKEQAFFARKV